MAEDAAPANADLPKWVRGLAKGDYRVGSSETDRG